MLKFLSLFFFVFLFSFSAFSQKEETPIRLVTAIQTNTTPVQRLRQDAVKKGHDVYTFTFTATDNCLLKAESLWIKDKTTIPLTIENVNHAKSVRLHKGDTLVLKAEANGLFPYQKPPKRFSSAALLSCQINNKPVYIEVKGILKE